MDRLRIGWIARGVALLAVFAMAVLAFRAGVDVSDRPGLPDADLLTQLYYAAGLFVLGGLDLGTPLGGPWAERTMLWTSYFLAPLITTSAVVEGALRLVGATSFERMGLRQHLVVVGLGRLGTTFVAAFRRSAKSRTIVAVDRDVQRAGVAQVRRQHRVRVVSGEARLMETFNSLALQRAIGVALLTEDDLLNLNTAFRLAENYPRLTIMAHVSNISMQRAAALVGADLEGAQLHVFNAHRVTAEHLYQHHLKPYFGSTQTKDTVVLAGFGRFGQTIFELLQQEASADIASLVVVDRVAALRLRTYRAQVQEHCTPEPLSIDGDLADPASWRRVQDELGALVEPPVIIIGSDDDDANLQSVLSARRCWPECRAFVRFQTQSVFAERLAARHNFVVLGVDDMLVNALAGAQKSWFSP